MHISRLAPPAPFLPSPGAPAVEWRVAPGLTAYADAVAEMEARATAIAEGRAAERVWLVEHPPLYTAGTSARDGNLLDARFPCIAPGAAAGSAARGAGQRVAYVMLDLRRRRPDVRAFVGALERWLIDTLAEFGVVGDTREGRVGVWVARPDKPAALDGAAAEDKIAALGIRVRHWVSFHGVAVNVSPDLSHFQGIVPCGIAQAHLGMTGREISDRTRRCGKSTLRSAAFEARFGRRNSATVLPSPFLRGGVGGGDSSARREDRLRGLRGSRCAPPP